jgi:Flp pilus assembly protein TadG
MQDFPLAANSKSAWRSRQAASVRAILTFKANRIASAMIEFAFIAPVVIFVALFLMSIGYIMVMQQTLDFATQKAARMIATGQVQAASVTQASFITSDICSNLPSMFTCANVLVNIQPVPINDGNYPNEYQGFLNSNGTGLAVPTTLANSALSYCPGNAGGYVYLQVLYPVTVPGYLFSNILNNATYNSAGVRLISATATFLNEPFVAPVGPC